MGCVPPRKLFRNYRNYRRGALPKLRVFPFALKMRARKKRPRTTSSLAEGSLAEATTTYTCVNDSLVSLVDPVGNETTWDYDAYGRETLMTDPRGGEVVKTYDSASRVA
ncbi:MAG: RHS repeat protein, partial [Gemmataceae bacterium]|nr:RHS repeat protein [Gemmataceae bacterium]